MKGFGKALQKLNSNCIFPRVVAKGIFFLLWDIPVFLHGHLSGADTHQDQLASGTDLAGKLRFGFGASGSMAAVAQPQHLCQISAAGKEEEDLARNPVASCWTSVWGSGLGPLAAACINFPGKLQGAVQYCCKLQFLILLA